MLLVKTVHMDEEGNPVVTKEGELPVVKTVRATFVAAQAVLVGLDLGSQGMEELESIAADSEAGVYGPDRIPDADEGPQRGGEAPRMLLSSNRE